ncbi:hypothetical protein [Umezawaea beigongshangensis]|uniref:hypothetical protein n=1 Tax=Umezawaea beigongshangensis TaxID=2780383 RepID=UPI0018F1AAFC|nr:hypothetical protein [Umezawaea beigongshangensis]
MAREHLGADLLANPDVHGVGVGLRRRAGTLTDEYAIVVHLSRKLPPDQVPEDRLVPRTLRFTTPDGREVVVPVDVQQRPSPLLEAAAVSLGSRVRPVPGGVSAGFAGTLGGWVWDTVTNQAVALSNRHVFGSLAGTRVPQPSAEDGGILPADEVAVVLRAGELDAAIAAPVSEVVADLVVLGLGPAVLSIADAAIGQTVRKTGRTTGLTAGVVDLIDYDSGHSGSRSDLWIDGDSADFSDAGDSGALYVQPDGAVVGLHWGGAGNDGVGHQIRDVFRDLSLTTLPAL